jgi:PQQ-dependent dehydrogenase (methanol/ethanol family)
MEGFGKGLVHKEGVMKGWGYAAGIVSCAALLLIAGASAKPGASAKKAVITPIPAFSADELTAAPTTDWVGVHGNIYNQQYSALTQINKLSIKNLKIAWHTQVAIPTKGKPNFTGVNAEAEPVVYQGTMYLPDVKGNVFAFDATTGERLWYYKYKPAKGFQPLLQVTRGVALGDGHVYVAQTDAKITALDQATGRVKWSTPIGDFKAGAFLTAAPAYADGMVITGVSGGDGGFPCTVVALNANTGKIMWKFNVIPHGNELGANTWPAKRAWDGGGAIWHTPAIDQKLGLVYLGVGNPVPYNGNVRGAGDELFTESILALHMKTGKYAWHYQTVHHDNWDYDTSANGIELFDLKIKGQMRQALAQAGKTGWVYILDRRTGKPILGINERKVPQEPAQHTSPTQPIPVGQPFAAQCPTKAWASWKAPDGNPVKIGCIFTPYNDQQYTVFAPSPLGGADWPPTSYSQRSGKLYICAKNSSSAWKALPEEQSGKLKPLGNFFQVDGLYAQKGSPATKPVGTVVAMNMRSNRRSWVVSFGAQDPCYSGILSTRGGLVFVGRSDGHFQAYDDLTGKLLWTSPKLAAGANAAAMTYAINGKQYVAIYAGGSSLLGGFGATTKAGSDLYAFALPSK